MAARGWTLGLEALTTVGAVAGVQGFLSGAFDPMVESLAEPLPFVGGPGLPAAALALLVGAPHAGALALGLRRHRLGAAAGMLAGGVLTVWVAAQAPLIGWGSPIQWTFFAVGVGEVVAAARWRRAASPVR